MCLYTDKLQIVDISQYSPFIKIWIGTFSIADLLIAIYRPLIIWGLVEILLSFGLRSSILLPQIFLYPPLETGSTEFEYPVTPWPSQGT